ncbi:MAG: hypothetical protein FJZ63_03965 [Chlamydiae bacterium]|nr:hypothetical protein [Chlamydiota bacterium]
MRYFFYFVSCCLFLKVVGEESSWQGRLSKPLDSYALCMMNFVEHPRDIRAMQKKLEIALIQQHRWLLNKALNLMDIAYSLPPQMGVKANVKYKKVKITRDERPNPLLNFRAREVEIIEGFEASEVVLGSLKLHPDFKLLARVGLFEKWVTVLDEGEEFVPRELVYRPTTDVVTGTLKYALGGLWEKEIAKKRSMSVEWMFEQKALHEWKIKESLLKGQRGTGLLFDHWILTLSLGF